MCINPRVASLAAQDKHRLMSFDRHITEDVCLDKQDAPRILKPCLDRFLSNYLSCNLESVQSFTEEK